MLVRVNNPAIVFEKKIRGVNSGTLASFVTEASRVVRLRATVSVLITGNSAIRRLNSRFRGKDRPTDVLSFPSAASEDLAGDIAISIDIASRNARLLGHSISDEIQILILHGILHLAGYDHENDDGEMAKKETLLRQRFGLPTGLIERNSATHTRKKSAIVPLRRSRT
jgi:probable rRNA maturation factor